MTTSNLRVTDTLRVQGLCKEYGSDEGLVRAVDEITLEVWLSTVSTAIRCR
jgi:hypothetical protein